jgi:surfactin synthase thioesterase subunit
MPIHAYAGAGDTEGSPERMRGWRAFALDVVAGGHFFDPSGERHVIRTVVDELQLELAGGRPAFM